ncbi:Unknown protein sequence [Pseudomonas syringae pv. maculicola str. M6]|nr:Unknown protein sequence [Pseudomonas syringae pv. maculicola str. M6]
MQRPRLATHVGKVDAAFNRDKDRNRDGGVHHIEGDVVELIHVHGADLWSMKG